MPDWQRLVRERLGRLGLSPQRDAEIADELSGYLEDRFEVTRSEDCSPEISDWNQLARNLRRASTEETMNERTRTLWIPGLLTLAVASVLWRVLLFFGLEPSVIMLNEKRFEILYLFTPWLVALPLIGAAGAFWARRQGARPIQRALITTFPALGMMAFFSFGIIAQLVLNPRMFVTHTLALLYFLASFVFIPAACLLLGALPFLRNSTPPAAKPV